MTDTTDGDGGEDSNLSPQLRAEIGRLVEAGEKLRAISLVREATGYNLSRSNDVVDRLTRGHPVVSRPRPSTSLRPESDPACGVPYPTAPDGKPSTTLFCDREEGHAGDHATTDGSGSWHAWRPKDDGTAARSRW